MGYFPILIALLGFVVLLCMLARNTVENYRRRIDWLEGALASKPNDSSLKQEYLQAKAEYNKLIMTYPARLYARMMRYKAWD